MRLKVAATMIALATLAPRAFCEMPEGIYVRIICFGHAFKSGWDADGHTAQDVLRMIEELKPDVLNRLVSGRQNWDDKIPVAAGSAPMSIIEFLNGAMKAGAHGCTISPKVHLNATWPDDYRIQAAQSLRDLPLTPRLTMLDLDCWFERPHDAAGNKALLEQFRNMGWTDFVTNPGPYKSAYGYESSVMTYMSERLWQPPEAKIKHLHEKGIKLPLLHIDYPYQMTIFRGLPPDRQADIITKNICPAQRKLGFRFIYPILIGHYDSTKIHTSKDGPYKGATMFEVMKQMIDLDRKELSSREKQ